jgi:hypothetical protein
LGIGAPLCRFFLGGAAPFVFHLVTPNGRLPQPPVKGTTLTALRFPEWARREWLRQAPDHPLDSP